MHRTIWTALCVACLLLAARPLLGQNREAEVKKKQAEAERQAKAEAEQRALLAQQQVMQARQARLQALQAQQVIILGGAGAATMPAASGASTAKTEPQGIAGDETLLRSVGVSTDGPGLLAFFRLRGQATAKPERLTALIEQLGDKSPLVAQKASGELASIGAPAIPALRRAVKDQDLHQTVLLAKSCLQALEEHPGQLSAAAARLIGQRRPRGTAEALLDFLPFAEDDSVIEEIRLALASVAHPDGKPDPALLKALRDKSPIRRALALDALCQNGLNAAILEAVPLRKLLQDPKSSVRLRAALTLARARDAQAISTLIALLAELPLEQASQAEDFLSELAGEQAPKTALGEDDASRKKCRDAWAAWWQKSEDGDRLLDELRKRTPTGAARRKCEELIRQLGDTEFSVREKAQSEIKTMGVLILPLLREAANHNDLEVRRRARSCLREMERDKGLPLSPVVARLIALRKPAGAAELLLAYVPYGDDDAIQTEVQLALNAVAFQDGKPEAAVVRALSDPLALRRAAAAEALCLGGDREHLPAIHELLRDSDPAVRLKTALALASIHERDAVPVLIDLIGELSGGRAEPAEEYLRRLALERAPSDLPSGDDEANRKKRQAVWSAWWKANGDRVALVERYPLSGIEHNHGYTLLVLTNNNQIVELDKDHKTRWTMNGLMSPRDAQVLGTDRILVAEFNAQRVTERNRKGDVLWQKQLPGLNPLSVQRLRNGHTFITCPNKLLEVDRGGREVISINRPSNDVVMARKMRDGQIVLVSTQRQCLRLDTTGKQLKSFQLQQMVWQHNGVDILPNGHVLVPHQPINRVIEYDANGKSVFEATAMQPLSACHLPRGRVLIAPQQFPTKVVEVDSSGKQVGEFTAPNIVYRIRRR
ncbi:MAG TPA: HEAT repeat domain-containing protein [Gemmataceae bacterium]|jgi:HEAT repeat protein